MISGIGVDLVRISRMEQVLGRISPGALARMFTAAELGQAALRRGGRTSYLATRFAAKEAVFKALSASLGGASFDLRRVETLDRPDGRPYVVTDGYLGPFLRAGGVRALHISISTEEDMACAFVVAES